MSCRHSLALGTCRECYPETGTIVPDWPAVGLDGPAAVPAKAVVTDAEVRKRVVELLELLNHDPLSLATVVVDKPGTDPEPLMQVLRAFAKYVSWVLGQVEGADYRFVPATKRVTLPIVGQTPDGYRIAQLPDGSRLILHPRSPGTVDVLLGPDEG